MTAFRLNRSDKNPEIGITIAAVRENRVIMKLLWDLVIPSSVTICGRIGINIELPKTRTNGIEAIAINSAALLLLFFSLTCLLFFSLTCLLSFLLSCLLD